MRQTASHCQQNASTGQSSEAHRTAKEHRTTHLSTGRDAFAPDKITVQAGKQTGQLDLSTGQVALSTEQVWCKAEP